MDKFSKISFGLVVLAFVLYPISDIICIGVALLALCFALFHVKDAKTSSRLMQPILLLGGVYALRGVIAFIESIIDYFARTGDDYYSSGFSYSVADFNYVMYAIYLILVLAILVVSIIFFALKKDIPVVNKLADKVNGIVSESKEKTKKENKKEKVEVEIEEPSDK